MDPSGSVLRSSHASYPEGSPFARVGTFENEVHAGIAVQLQNGLHASVTVLDDVEGLLAGTQSLEEVMTVVASDC